MHNEQLSLHRVMAAGIALLAMSACHDAPRAITGVSVSTQLHLEGPRVVRAPASRYFIERERVIGYGERGGHGQGRRAPPRVHPGRGEARDRPERGLAAGGCIISNADTLSPGQRVGERLVEYDPTTCAYIMARGEWLPKPATSVSSRSTSPLRSTGGSTRSAPVAAQSTAAAAASPAWQKLFYEDPIQINVTETLLEVHYELSGGCVSWSSSIHTTTWLDQSGWQLDFDDHYQVEGCSAWKHFGEAYFSNDSFCYPGITYNDYYTNEVTPLSDGRVAFSYSADAYGACSSALTFGRERST